MSKLIRYFAPSQFCFVTAVTAQRRPILLKHPTLMLSAVRRASRTSRFRIVAWVILPDHFHALLHVPNGDTSRIIQQVKLSFSLQYVRRSHEAGPVWQHRFWDHIIRNEEDLRRHVEYVHFNPVKHGYVTDPAKWRFSSYAKFVKRSDQRIIPIESDGERFGE